MIQVKRLHPVLLLTISDILANLSAAWFGAAFVVPVFSDKPLSFNISVLIMDIILGIVFGGVAFRIRTIKRR